MAWCTFSSDDFQCDLRLVSTFDGFMIMVAGDRILGDIPRTVHLDEAGSEDQLEAAERAQMEFVRTAVREPIDLPYAGSEFLFDEYGDFVSQVRELVDLGYRIPDAVASDLGISALQPTR